MTPVILSQADGTDATVIRPSDWNSVVHLLPLVSPDDYAVNTTPGSTDMSAAFTSALAAVADGGVLYMGDGPYYLATPVVLPVGATNRVRIVGNGSTVVKPATTGFLHNLTTAPCQNVELCYFDVNASAVAGAYSAIGSYHSGVQGHDCEWSNIYVHDIAITGPTTASGVAFHGVSIMSYQTAAGEGWLTTDNITIERVRMTGGWALAKVTGTVGGTSQMANIAIDNVTVKDCYHEQSASPTTNYSTSNYHFGAQATLGRIYMENLVGINSHDNGLEVNNAEEAFIINCSMKDSWITGYTLGNHRTDVDTDKQHYFVSGCSYEHTSTACQGIGIQGHDQAFGWLDIDNFSLLTSQRTQLLQITADYRRLTLDGVDGDYVWNTTLTGNTTTGLVYVADSGGDHNHDMKGVQIRCSGTVAGAFQFGPRIFDLSGPSTNFSLRDCHLKYSADTSATTSVTKYFIRLGTVASSVCGVIYDGCSVTTTTDAFTGFQSSTNNTPDATHVIRQGIAWASDGSTVITSNLV